MFIEEAVFYHLTNDADVTAIIGTRAFPNAIPQDADLPAMAYQVISRPGQWRQLHSLLPPESSG